MQRPGREEILLDSWDWLAYAGRLPSKPIAPPLGVAAALAFSGRCIITGGWFNNTATAGGHVSIFDSVDGSGLEVSRFAMGASSVANVNIPSRGILLDIGCWVSVSQGTLLGAVYIIPLWHYDSTPPGH